MIQGSPEWLAVRCGKITGSRFRAVLDLNKRNRAPNASRRRLADVLIEEVTTGQPEYVEPNEYMLHGQALEPLARAAYGVGQACTSEVPALLRHPHLPCIGYSPGGLVAD